jgi:HSP90 family molecular chaperone
MSSKKKRTRRRRRPSSPWIKKLKETLWAIRVKAVKVSNHLDESPSCIITDSSDPTFQMINMMKQMGNKDLPTIKPILEVNPDHPIIEENEGHEKERRLQGCRPAAPGPGPDNGGPGGRGPSGYDQEPQQDSDKSSLVESTN